GARVRLRGLGVQGVVRRVGRPAHGRDVPDVAHGVDDAHVAHPVEAHARLQDGAAEVEAGPGPLLVDEAAVTVEADALVPVEEVEAHDHPFPAGAVILPAPHYTAPHT